ncbi:hypothetical protein [Pseudomonas aeruginosa]|uniref:hypothetical protein n=1 Tax=Pseudomonas aeruginosa TaxID=287 RepID=UPI00157F950F|nr:hypothetical protein [Pseudomonas aeruginosa]EKW7238643.1 hypothetical protein [Pseudomonas aeruginosa]MBI8834194.1 hypothetical protein [Pseudomonas aeruginosa]QKR06981.1 hypothetical protein HB744_22285 [Pseudomonas aeruginosa]
MNHRRTAIWLGSLFGGLLYLFILAAGPIWGGIITAESTHLSAGFLSPESVKEYDAIHELMNAAIAKATGQ